MSVKYISVVIFLNILSTDFIIIDWVSHELSYLTYPMISSRQHSTPHELPFQESKVKGCFFHLCQDVWMKIQQNWRRDPLCEDDGDSSLLMRSITAFAFVPEDDP